MIIKPHETHHTVWVLYEIDFSVQDCSNSIANALEFTAVLH